MQMGREVEAVGDSLTDHGGREKRKVEEGKAVREKQEVCV